MPSYITSIGTAVPENCIEQSSIADFMVRASQLDANEARKLRVLYRSTKIRKRYSVLNDYSKTENFEFYPNTVDLEPFPSVSQRMLAYRQHALPLALNAVKAALTHNNDVSKIPNFTHLITVSCTGLYAPGLDIELVEALGLSRQVQRTSINFMGCYGAFNGLKMANTIVQADPQAKVLLVCIELCTLHFQKKIDDNYLLSNALFADGAAAVIIEGQPKRLSLEMQSFHCDLLFEGRNDMAWHVGDFGFEMVLSSYIPRLVKGGLGELMSHLQQNTTLPAFDFYAIHPGGRAILEAAENQLGLTPEDNRYAYEVLSDYGNMSSCTVLFVLQKLLQERTPKDVNKHIFSCAFGPGLTLETGIFKIAIS
ncbi:type III polyketide synthase [Runella salmonicolor]|uniref:Type III polyketide synthase n=1 Tax=Runella salmonicolor TaxID=2950278 RepID=A0ABT1FKG7_9BACT|nr:type III polyketide synthase [Runella salmonicolor]MCP1382226.1 type III polyketide synthase [Runella salmonicolor]